MFYTGKLLGGETGTLSLEELKSRQARGENLRISDFRYPGGAEVDGSMCSALCLVSKGQCRYTFKEGLEYVITEGEWLELPKGDYKMRVLSDCGVEMLLVWDISFIREEEVSLGTPN